MMPGQFEAFAHRKAFCEKRARKGIAAGATQVLVLGAGYDTLGWRLAPEFPEDKFVYQIPDGWEVTDETIEKSPAESKKKDKKQP